MKFHILTLFPEMIEQGLQKSITGKAIEKGNIAINAVNIRDYTEDKHKKVDDYTYGGGAGMLMQAQPVYDAFLAVKDKMAKKNARVIYVTPQGSVFNQRMAEEFAKEEELVFLCGHYEGVDERVLEEIVTDYVSIGDYVLTGGELPAMIMIDAIARLVPDVLHNEESAQMESFHNNLLEYPQYSRPEIWRNRQVPPILLSGNHKKIDEWRLEQSVKRTKERRPDLYSLYQKSISIIERLKKNKLLYMDMIEPIRLGRADILYDEADGILIFENKGETYMAAAKNKEAGKKMLATITEPESVNLFVAHQDFMEEVFQEQFPWLSPTSKCIQAVYTRGVPLTVSKEIEIRQLDMSYVEVIHQHYKVVDNIEYIKDRINAGVFYGAFLENKLAGFVGIHTEGSMGMLEVFEEFRRKGIAVSLEAHCINKQLQAGKIPYCQIFYDNDASIKLQEKIGMRFSKEYVRWYKMKYLLQ